MKRQLQSMKLVSFVVILSVLSTLFVPNEASAASLKDGTLNDEFSDFRLENIGASNADFSFDTKESDDGIDSSRLFYVLIDSNDELADTDVFNASSELKTMLDSEEVYGLSNPDLLLNTDGGKVIRYGSNLDLRSGLTNEEINLSGLAENKNYRLYVGASSPEMDKPNVDVDSGHTEPNASSPELIEDRYVRVTYTGDSLGDPNERDFKVQYLDGTSRNALFTQNLEENASGDLLLDFEFDFDNQLFGDQGDFGGTTDFEHYKYYMTISNGVEINKNDSWILQFDNNGVLDKSQNSIINVPHTEFVSATSDNSSEEIFTGDGEILFSTDPFPSLLDGAGNSQAGFSVSNTPTDQDFRYLRGVASNRRGEVTLRFDDDIAITSKGREQIQIVGSDGEDFRDYDRSVSLNNSDDSILEIPFVALDPGKEYYVSIPAGSLALDTGTFGLGQLNLGNEFNQIIFFTEKKPEIASTFFNPGNDTFDHNYSPFSLNPTDDIYRIPELVGINKLGVGLNQQLVVSFRDKIELNGNPDGKLQISSSGDNRNLTATASINENRPNELIITIKHGDNNQKLLRPDVIYELVIEPGIVKDHYGGGAFAESSTINVDFKTADGFKNAFLDKSSYELNSGLLQTPSHNIAIDVPKVYIRNVETIHYRQGLAPDAQVAPNITNVDVEADPDVAYLTVTTNQDERSMLERGANGKFTATFAGLSSNVTQLEITAYDVNENELVTRIFRLQGAPGSEFKNDYVPEITDVFGKRISLYELMQQPDLMRQVLEQIPVSELDRIGVLEPFFAPYNDVP
ncbi:hypothetical protein H0266_11435 [Halobacillus locisalis]|uniref:SbsA Ig-like domain-containing protein n=1 Tax=Halobacillus locisalis TaxID=220753 RepID=A0A838CV61_9BACI|nr:hypothetical protein [Halobacillus locisalis]MBA2175506.1 hypothetical protein [Halobacillus locisalis]